MPIEPAPRPRDGSVLGDARFGRLPRFPVRLRLSFFSRSTGVWGTGLTSQINRSAVAFVPSGATVRVGDVLQYVLALPDSAERAGAVASCRGRVVRADEVVVVTIDWHRLQSAAAARCDSRDACKRRLVDLCEAIRLDRLTRRAAAMPAAVLAT